MSMEDKYVLNKLVRALSNLPDNDLRKLASVLRQPGIGEELGKLIESVFALRKAERNIISHTDKKEEFATEVVRGRIDRANLNIRDNHLFIRSIGDVRNTFETLLENKDLFPSTKDVVEAVNSEFQCGINYADFRKRGRKDVIKKCLSQLEKLPNGKQISLIKSFFYKVYREHGELEQYRKFFRILAGYE
jgi:hypothetical protein